MKFKCMAINQSVNQSIDLYSAEAEFLMRGVKGINSEQIRKFLNSF